jgi:hypothetical protein
MCCWAWLYVRHSWPSIVTVTAVCCISYAWLAALAIMRLAGWMGILGPMLIFAGLGDVHIAGGVPASKMPMHWVNQSDSTRLDNTDGEIC